MNKIVNKLPVPYRHPSGQTFEYQMYGLWVNDELVLVDHDEHFIYRMWADLLNMTSVQAR